MVMKKTTPAYISNDYRRKQCRRRRTEGLLKKVDDISALCGIEACAIIDDPASSQRIAWPSSFHAAQTIERFRNLPSQEQMKNKFDHEAFLIHRLNKAREQLRKQRIINGEREITQLMYRCLDDGVPRNLSLVQLNDLFWAVERLEKGIDHRMASMQDNPVA